MLRRLTSPPKHHHQLAHATEPKKIQEAPRVSAVGIDSKEVRSAREEEGNVRSAVKSVILQNNGRNR